jgi:hypothetical protein
LCIAKAFALAPQRVSPSAQDRGAKASAVMFSLIETAKECGLNPYDYLADVFRRAPYGYARGSLLPQPSDALV